MYFWMVIALIVVASSTVGAAAWLMLGEMRRNRETAFFFQEVDKEAMSGKCKGAAYFSLPGADIAAYEKAKLAMYQQYADPEKSFDPFHEEKDDDEMGEIESPFTEDEPWQRSMPIDAKKTLRALLVKRAMGSILALRQLPRDLSAKHRLNQMQLMNPMHWEKLQKYSSDLDRELCYVSREAEAIQANWGEQVFRDATIFYQHNITKVEKAKQLVKHEREEREERERQERLADKRMKGLLRAEENDKKRRQSAQQPTAKAPKRRLAAKS